MNWKQINQSINFINELNVFNSINSINDLLIGWFIKLTAGNQKSTEIMKWIGMNNDNEWMQHPQG